MVDMVVGSYSSRYNISTHKSAYQTNYLNTKEIYAVCLHASRTGPIIQCLSGPDGRRMTGEIMLNFTQVGALKASEFYIRVYSKANPKGEQGQQLIF
jgi:hypothetical protein